VSDRNSCAWRLPGMAEGRELERNFLRYLRVPGGDGDPFIRLGGGEDGRAVFSETDAFE